MDHAVRAVWITITLAVSSICLAAGASTEAEIQYAANNMKVSVIVGTNHEIGGSYKLTIQLINPGTVTMLPQQDWFIMFHHQNPIQETLSSDGQLLLHVAESCMSVLVPVKGSGYNGIPARGSISIELEVQGLSIFRSLIYPNFAIYSSAVGPMNILSTADDDLSFVSLAPANQSVMDRSLMTGIDRMLSIPDTIDQGRVPPVSFVIPAPLRVSAELTRIMDLAQSQRLNYYFSPGISQAFQDIFIAALARIPNVGMAKLFKVTSYVAGQDLVNVTIVDPNSPEGLSMTEDGYHFTVTPKDQTHYDIKLIAKAEKGLYNANATFFGMLGIFSAIPPIQIQDDTSYAVRSVELDLVKNFFPLPVLMKMVHLLAMYKLNFLVLNLAGNDGWRLEMLDGDFEELHTYASRRSINLEQGLPPLYGAGAAGTPSSNGYLTAVEFKELIKYASDHGVSIIPKFNYGGGMLAAKMASHRRYDRLKDINMAQAQMYMLVSGEPTGEQPPKDESCRKHAALNPCIPQTEQFISLVNRYVQGLYAAVGVNLVAIHAGGDEWVNSYQYYPECKALNLGTPALLRRMVSMIQGNTPAITMVNEDLVVDRTTMDCIPPQDASGVNIDTNNLIVVFSKDILVDAKSWGLTPEEESYLFRDVAAPPESANDTAEFIPDFQIPYTGVKRGIKAPWSKAYTCANNDYKVVLNPEAYSKLDAGYELSWDEFGNHKSDRYSTINRHRMMLLEPRNIHINIDQASDMQPVLAHRFCQVFDCAELTTAGDRNLIGLLATIDTAVIRTERRLWENTASRLVMHAEKAWRIPPFENTLKPTNLSTYENPNVTALRSQQMLLEMTHFLNSYGYKEEGRLEAIGVTPRVGRVSAAIANGLAGFQPRAPPYGIVVKTDQPGKMVQYRDKTNSTWRQLYWADERTGAIQGGYTFQFPDTNQEVELRLVSTDNQRSSIPTKIRGSAEFLMPPAIPINLREDACLDVRNLDIDITKLKPQQWAKVFNNIAKQTREAAQFGQQRMQQLEGHLNRYKQFDRTVAQLTLMQVMNGIEQLMGTERPLYGVYEYIFNQDKLLIEQRENDLKAKFESWHQKYLKDPQCPKPKQQKA